jgi:hypothetical protein
MATPNNEVQFNPKSAFIPEALYLRSGFLRVEAEVRAVPTDELEPINLDVPATVETVRNAHDRIIAYREELAELGPFDVKNVDNLRDYALALGHTHVENRSTEEPVDRVAEMAEKAVDARELFLADAAVLVKRNMVSRETVDKLRSGTSYRSIAYDVLGLVKLFENHWETVGSRTMMTRGELDAAHTLANELLAMSGSKENTPPAVTDASLLRQQAYTLLVKTYADVRDAIIYIRRRHGDADEIAPSLWAGRGKRPTPQAPAATPTPPSAPAPTTSSPPTSNTVPVGFPGDSPFIE